MFLSDTTTDAFVQVFMLADAGEGLLAFGGIKNTGASNSMSVRVTMTDKWGDTDNTVFIVAPLTKLSFDSMNTAYGATQPPYQSMTVEVMSTSAGLSTTFDLYTVN